MRPDEKKELLKNIGKFCTPDDRTAILEISATLGMFFMSFALMIYSLDISYFLVLAILPLPAILMTRLFTIQHDCGHSSYFSSLLANNIVGGLLGVITLTPYYYWRKNHRVHHAFSGNLDKRGIGDVDTYTVREYQALPLWKKIKYRIYRNPFFLLVLAPLFLYGIKHRLPLDNPFHSLKGWTNIMLTNLGIGGAIAALVHFFGAEAFFLVYLPVAWLGCSIGIAGFYIQHQYEDAYWSRNGEWSYFDAGLHGSSYFEFPKILNWLVNDINLHHIHHLNGQVPSYRLRECLRAVPALQAVRKRTLAEAAACFRVALWDEERRRMVGFS